MSSPIPQLCETTEASTLMSDGMYFVCIPASREQRTAVRGYNCRRAFTGSVLAARIAGNNVTTKMLIVKAKALTTIAHGS